MGIVKNGPYELVVAPKGYPGKRYRGRYAYEHHVVWWRHTGKLVPRGWLLHHRNEKKRDNRFRNLKLELRGEHTVHHSTKPPVKLVCHWCKKPMELRNSTVRWRLKNSLSGKLFCSRRCGAKHQFSTTRAPRDGGFDTLGTSPGRAEPPATRDVSGRPAW